MNRAIVNALLVLLAFACVSSTCNAEQYTSSEPAYIRQPADVPTNTPAAHGAI
ncbi:hypothetical protein IWW38_004927, partial [Coemansia aciculifera]